MFEIRGCRQRPLAGTGRWWIGLMCGAVAVLCGCRSEVDADRDPSGDTATRADRDQSKTPTRPGTAAAKAHGPWTAGDSAVLVVLQIGAFEQVLPGFVARSDGENAYVVVGGRIEPLRQDKEEPRQMDAEIVVSVIWGREPTYHRVKARAVGDLRERGVRFVAAPAAEMPPALPIGPAPRIAAPASVKLDGFQWFRGQGRRGFARAVENGVIAGIEPSREDNADVLRIEGPNVANVDFGVVTTADGVAVATFTTFADPYHREAAQSVVGVPLLQLDAALDPEIQLMLLAPRKGDAKTVEYEFLLWMEAPAGKADSVRLFAKRSSQAAGEPSCPRSADGRRARFARDAAELKLVQGKPSEEVVAQGLVPGQLAGRTTWIARHIDANPGPGGAHVFDIQLAIQREDGSWSYDEPHRLHYRGGAGRPMGEEPPDIPGFDDQHLDVQGPPRPKMRPGAADPFAPPAKELSAQYVRELRPWVDAQAPAPRNVKRLFLGDVKTADGAKFTRLVVKSDSLGGLAFSDDGQAAILGGRTGLVRISLADFRTAVELEIPGFSPATDGQSLLYCKEGVVLRGGVRSPTRTTATGETPNLLVVDPNTLRIKRAFQVKGRPSVSPASSSCLLVDEHNAVLADLASATVTDLLTPEVFVQRAAAVQPQQEAEARGAAQSLRLMSLSEDGRAALSPGSLWTVRDGRLTFGRFLPDSARLGLISATGDPGYFAAYDPEDRRVYAVQSPAKPSFRVPVVKGFTSPFVMVPARQRVYVLNNNLLGVLDYRGKELGIITLPDSNDKGTRLAASRDGKRLLVGTLRPAVYLVALPDSL
jgi:hypothetical protein